jgi:hypothetical protein
MGWASYMSKSSALEVALDEAIRGCKKALDPDMPVHLAIIFVSSNYAKHYKDIVPTLRKQLPDLQIVIGCSGSGVVGMCDSRKGLFYVYYAYYMPYYMYIISIFFRITAGIQKSHLKYLLNILEILL